MSGWHIEVSCLGDKHDAWVEWTAPDGEVASCRARDLLYVAAQVAETLLCSAEHAQGCRRLVLDVDGEEAVVRQ